MSLGINHCDALAVAATWPTAFRNISQQEVYVEVYAEDFKSKAWTDTDYTYDLLRDPRTRYEKLVIVDPDMMRPGASVNVTYDRCLKPSFVKQTGVAFINAIKKKDNEARTPVWQRFRVDVYILDQGHVKRVQQVGSNSFERVHVTSSRTPLTGKVK